MVNFRLVNKRNMAFLRNALVAIDGFVGLRAWGLILYGALPATFSLLGAKDIKIDVGDTNVFYALIASPLPLIILYLLIRTKCRDWYLSERHLFWRSLITTIMILVASTSICAITGVIKGHFYFTGFFSLDYINLVKPFLLAIVSLVLSSVLFMGILTKGSQLPLMPRKELVGKLYDFKKFKREFGSSSIWNEHNIDEIQKQRSELYGILEQIEDAIAEARCFMKLSVVSLKKQLEIVEEYLNDINGEDDTHMGCYEAYFKKPDEMERPAAKKKYEEKITEIMTFRSFNKWA